MHDLWIFPPPRASRWFARQDWYLNWQMSRGLSYAGLHLPAAVGQVAETHGVPVPRPPEVTNDLLVLPGSLVPTKKCLVLDDHGRPLAEWFARIAARATALRARTARIFLPSGRTVPEATAAWAALGSDLRVSFEPDLETAR